MDATIKQAHANRKDLAAMLEQTKGYEEQRKAATADRYPTVKFDGDYGDIGVNVRHSHETGDAQGTLSVPVFKEYGLRGEAQVAQSQLDTQKAQLSDLNAQVDADVRDALLDIEAAQKQVEVARSSVDLANEALSEAQQRYANGVSDNLAVSQAQQSVAQANDQYVSSLYRDNVAKLSFGACVGSGAGLQELFGREVNVADTTTTTVQAPRDESTEVAQPPSRRRGIIIVVVVILVLVGLGFWWHSTYYEDTDDAQINGHLIQISSRIAGQVVHVDVDENQLVKAGDPIAELDPRDYQVAVENAQAALASAKAAAAAANVNVPITSINTGSNLSSAGADVSAATASISQAQSQLAAAHAQVVQAEANAMKAQQDLDRYKPLVEKDVISKQQYDAAVAASDAAKAAVDNAHANEKAAGDGVQRRQRQGGTGAGAIQICADRTAAGSSAVGARQAGRWRRWRRRRRSSTRRI